MPHQVLVRLTRGNLVESIHHGSYCVVRDGERVKSRGDPGRRIFFRSAAKPIQTIAVVESGAPDRFGFTDEELALVVGSHSGSRQHAQTALSMLRKAGEGPELLRCGGHTPLSRAVYEQYVREGYQWKRLEDNCSGKHAGMIAAAKARGADPRTYADPGHPVQQANLANVALLSGLPAGEIGVGTDGCAVPSFALPVEAMARAMARFAAPDGLADGKAAAIRRVTEVALRHPEMVAGDGRFDTFLIRAGRGRLLAKEGADGVQVLAVIGEGTGIAVKVADGARRALKAVTSALLIELGILSPEELRDYYPLRVLSREGDPVGEIEVTL